MDMQQMFAEARKMQAQLTDAQDHLGDIEVTGTAGGGAVRITATANMQLTGVTIAADACDPQDVEMLEDMILAATNEALASAQAAADEQMARVTGGISIPGLF